jgi:hypothetical protein
MPIRVMESGPNAHALAYAWPAKVSVSVYPATAGVVAPVVLESPPQENGGRFRYGSVTPGTYFVVAQTLSAGIASQLAATPAMRGSVPRVLTTSGQRIPL